MIDGVRRTGNMAGKTKIMWIVCGICIPGGRGKKCIKRHNQKLEYFNENEFKQWVQNEVTLDRIVRDGL